MRPEKTVFAAVRAGAALAAACLVMTPACIVARPAPALAQAPPPGGVPPGTLPRPTPEAAVDGLLTHLKQQQARIKEPVTLGVKDENLHELERRLDALACVIAIADSIVTLRAWYEDDEGPPLGPEFDRKVLELQSAIGTEKQQADTIREGRARVDRLLRALDDERDETAVSHELYHRARSKKMLELFSAGLPLLYRPLRAWGTIACTDKDCQQGPFPPSGTAPGGTRER